MIALFIAGGSGTRLWPISRQNKPKQLQVLVGRDSLMTQTVDRIAPIIDTKDVWIVTNKSYVEQIAEHIPKVLRAQIIAEPVPLGTNLAVGLGAIHVAKNNPEAVIVVGWADSYVGNEAEFLDALIRAERLATKVDGVILAVKTTYPATAYGYIETGNPIPGHDGAFTIARFEEKPTNEQAEKFFKSDSHYWNSGISVWKVSTLIRLIKQYKPDHYNALRYVAEAIGTSDHDARMKKAFDGLDRTAIDHAIFEKAKKMATIPVDLDWNDIGSWSAIYDVQNPEEGGNITRGKVISVDTKNCLIYGQKRLITTLGVSDLVIVETDDAILVAHKDETERLKELHAQVKTLGGTKYL